VGSGGGLHEGFLARTRPRLDVTGVDLNEPWVDRDLPNLRFLTGDFLEPAFRTSLRKADFCYSIECLEHIEDDWTVVRAMADLLAPGGFLYLQVPFASPAEQRDTELCAAERRNHGHVRPGYDGEGIRAFARKLGLEVVLVAGAFWSPLHPIIFAAVEKFGAALAPQWQAILDLARLDLRTGVPANRAEATAIKMLARKPA
jgi:SAM-dependent methyltransferase